MATGSGKTKVMSLLITSNIIVLDRIKSDFEGLKIFYEDPILPDNGFGGQNWRDDFQITLHLQNNVNTVRKTGNIFLTNIHRIYNSKNTVPSFDDEDTTDQFLCRRFPIIPLPKQFIGIL